MKRNNNSLSSRIFFYMMVFIVIESILIAGVTLFQFNKQNAEYHSGRLERKENNLLVDIKYEIQDDSLLSLDSIKNKKILQIADIHNIEFELYSLEGKLIKSSTATTGVPGNTYLDSTIANYFKQSDLSLIHI